MYLASRPWGANGMSNHLGHLHSPSMEYLFCSAPTPHCWILNLWAGYQFSCNTKTTTKKDSLPSFLNAAQLQPQLSEWFHPPHLGNHSNLRLCACIIDVYYVSPACIRNADEANKPVNCRLGMLTDSWDLLHCVFDQKEEHLPGGLLLEKLTDSWKLLSSTKVLVTCALACGASNLVPICVSDFGYLYKNHI